MRFGAAWRIAVLASLALLMSSQLCMLTTCLPRFHHQRRPAHAGGRVMPQPPMRAPTATGARACGTALDGPRVSALGAVMNGATPTALIVAAAVTLAPSAHEPLPVAVADSGPPPGRRRTAPAGQRAPPQA